MYDFLDRSVADLSSADRKLLDATRAWVHQLTMAGVGTPAAAGKMGRGSDAFDAAMRALDKGSSETIVFQRPCHPRVSETEAVWLGIWRLVRADRVAAATAALGGFVDTGSADRVAGAMVKAAATV